jgi:hypothetical protein
MTMKSNEAEIREKENHTFGKQILLSCDFVLLESIFSDKEKRKFSSSLRLLSLVLFPVVRVPTVRLDSICHTVTALYMFLQTHTNT